VYNATRDTQTAPACRFTGKGIMQPLRSNKQVLERLDYIGSMVRELSRLSADDNHALLSYILNTALFEIEDLKKQRETSRRQGDHAA
jgi:hypothetical protein